ncbi:hypothetical protein IMX07_10870 [bacterium]|jgi:predicted nuclease with TOPRIM domain|nr:hypothetical protein [bacterium]
MGDWVFHFGSFGLGVINLLVLLAVWLGRHTLVTRGEFQEHVAGDGARIERLEELHKSGPGWTSVNDLRERFASLDGKLREVGAKLDALNGNFDRLDRSVDRIEQHLIGGTP